MKNTTNKNRKMQLRRILRTASIELTVESNTQGVVIIKTNDLDIILKNKSDIDFLMLDELKQLNLEFFFGKRIINIIDFYTDDTQLMQELTLEDIYLYLGIDKYYNYTDNTLNLTTEEDYKELLLDMDTDELTNYLTNLTTTEKREITETVVNMYKTNELTDYKKIMVFEQYLPHLYFEDIGE